MTQTTAIHGALLHLAPFNLAGPVARFSINRRDTNSRVGLLLVTSFSRSSMDASVELLIADPEKRTLYGPEALLLALEYAFEVRQLHRLAARAPEYDDLAIGQLEGAGFCLEAQQRQAIFRRGRYWDELVYGMLATDWKVKVQYQVVPLPIEGYC